MRLHIDIYIFLFFKKKKKLKKRTVQLFVHFVVVGILANYNQVFGLISRGHVWITECTRIFNSCFDGNPTDPILCNLYSKNSKFFNGDFYKIAITLYALSIIFYLVSVHEQCQWKILMSRICILFETCSTSFVEFRGGAVFNTI